MCQFESDEVKGKFIDLDLIHSKYNDGKYEAYNTTPNWTFINLKLERGMPLCLRPLFLELKLTNGVLFIMVQQNGTVLVRKRGM